MVHCSSLNVTFTDANYSLINRQLIHSLKLILQQSTYFMAEKRINYNYGHKIAHTPKWSLSRVEWYITTSEYTTFFLILSLLPKHPSWKSDLHVHFLEKLLFHFQYNFHISFLCLLYFIPNYLLKPAVLKRKQPNYSSKWKKKKKEKEQANLDLELLIYLSQKREFLLVVCPFNSSFW
jgi:hypothetical protein